jgi:siroheme synthase-like protein
MPYLAPAAANVGMRAFCFMELYPVHLRLKGRTTLVVGGGPVAAIKAASLLQGGARVRIVAPSLSEEMRLLVEGHRLQCEIREFEPNDLTGVWLVVGATDSTPVQQAVYDEATSRNIMVCIVDNPSRSDFIAPAVLRRGELIVTVSTSGVAPALASRLRDYIGEILGESAARIVEDLKPVREKLRKEIPEFARRRDAWYELLDSKVMPALRRRRIADPLSEKTSGGEEDI